VRVGRDDSDFVVWKRGKESWIVLDVFSGRAAEALWSSFIHVHELTPLRRDQYCGRRGEMDFAGRSGLRVG